MRRAYAAGIVTASIRMIFPYGTRRKDSIKAVIFPFKAVTAQAEHKELKEHNDLRAAQKLSASGTGPRIRKPAGPQVGKPSPAGTNSSAQGSKKPLQETKPSLEGAVQRPCKALEQRSERRDFHRCPALHGGKMGAHARGGDVPAQLLIHGGLPVFRNAHEELVDQVGVGTVMTAARARF